jgi:hypothetical protein
MRAGTASESRPSSDNAAGSFRGQDMVPASGRVVARTRTSGNGVTNLHPYQAAEIRLTNWALPYELDFMRWKKLSP